MSAWVAHYLTGASRTYIPKWGRVLVVAGRLDLVEVIFVELPDEAGHVAVLEVLGKYRPRELFTLHKVLTR